MLSKDATEFAHKQQSMWNPVLREIVEQQAQQQKK